MRSTVVPRSDRLDLRPLVGTDAGFIESLYASADVTRTLLRIQRPISIHEAREFCTTPSAAAGEHRLVAVLRANDQPVGVGTLRIHAMPADRASIGYTVLPTFWRQGIGTELAALLVDYAVQVLGAVEIRATTLDETSPPRVCSKSSGLRSWRRGRARPILVATSAV